MICVRHPGVMCYHPGVVHEFRGVRLQVGGFFGALPRPHGLRRQRRGGGMRRKGGRELGARSVLVAGSGQRRRKTVVVYPFTDTQERKAWAARGEVGYPLCYTRYQRSSKTLDVYVQRRGPKRHKNVPLQHKTFAQCVLQWCHGGAHTGRVTPLPWVLTARLSPHTPSGRRPLAFVTPWPYFVVVPRPWKT